MCYLSLVARYKVLKYSSEWYFIKVLNTHSQISVFRKTTYPVLAFKSEENKMIFVCTVDCDIKKKKTSWYFFSHCSLLDRTDIGLKTSIDFCPTQMQRQVRGGLLLWLITGKTKRHMCHKASESLIMTMDLLVSCTRTFCFSGWQ